MTAPRVAAAGLVLALGAILFHATGFGYDEVRRPFVVLGAALVLAGGAASGRGSSWLLRMSDVALLAIGVSALFAINRTEAATALFPAATAWIILRGAAMGWIPRPFLERRGLLLLSGVGVLFSGYGMIQSYTGVSPAVSTLGNTNYAGVLSALFAVAGLAAAFALTDGRARGVGAAAALLGVLHLAASGSLGGMIGLGAGATAFALLLVRRHGWKPVALVPLVLLAVAVVPVGKRVATRVSDIARGEDRTSRVRLGLWKGALRIATAHPVLGCGTGNFRMALPPYRDADERKLSNEGKVDTFVEAEDAHNSYLHVLAESGPVALISILAALALALAAGLRRVRDPDPEASSLSLAATAGLVTLAVSGLFNSLSGHLPFAVVAGLLAGVAGPVVPAVAPAPSRGMRFAWIAVAAVLALATIPWFIADARYRDAMHTSRPEERLVYAHQALAALPGHWQAKYEAARSWRAIGENEGSVRADLREVLTVHPHHVPALIELSTGRPIAEEEELLLRAEKLAPEFVLLQTRLAGIDLRRRNYASGRNRFDRILEALPEDPEALFMIGRTWLWERRPEEALPLLRRAIAKNPKMRERLSEGHPELRGDTRFSELLGP